MDSDELERGTGGQGTETFLDGRKYVGEWQDGKPSNVTRYD